MRKMGRDMQVRWKAARTGAMLWLVGMVVVGCARGPVLIGPDARKAIDRQLVEYPTGYVLKTVARGLTAPSAMAIVNDEGEYKGSILIAESGDGGNEPRIYGWKLDGTYFSVYPRVQRIPGPIGLLQGTKPIHAPIGGMVATQGRIFVSHRDANGRGVISSLGYDDGSITTVVADLPAQGDFSVTDIAVDPIYGRLYFGLGAATNSGVVGLDNWDWVKRYPNFCDLPATPLKLLGYKFFTKNPTSGLFGGSDIAVTGPFQAFGQSDRLRIPEAPNDKPTAAIYSVSPTGGNLRVEASGIRLPRGLAFLPGSTQLFATNNGMELRGTRPVKDDPDALLKISPGTDYGWPDHSADLFPISESRFQEPELIRPYGYPENSFLIDRAASGLSNPTEWRKTLLFGVFPSLSGAAKFDFAPASGAFRKFGGNAIVALGGDRAPFATSGRPLKAPVGYKVVRVDQDSLQKTVENFVYNPQGLPASKLGRGGVEGIERPIDIKFSPDGNQMFILDYGRMENRAGKPKITAGSGKIFVLEVAPEPTMTTKSAR